MEQKRFLKENEMNRKHFKELLYISHFPIDLKRKGGKTSYILCPSAALAKSETIK